MCGAVSIQYDSAMKESLSKFFTAEEIARFEQNGEIVFAYWDKRPVLPVRKGNEICFFDWGNRDDTVPLPKTGWARLESLLEKKWDRFKPKVVLIPAVRGCEKKVWFDLTADIKGWRESLKDPAKGAALAANVYGKDLGLKVEAATEESKSQNELILNEDTKTNGIMTVSDEMVEETIKSLGFAGLDVTADQIFDLSLIEKIYADNPDLKADPTA